MADKNKPLKSPEPKALVIHIVTVRFKWIDKIASSINRILGDEIKTINNNLQKGTYREINGDRKIIIKY